MFDCFVTCHFGLNEVNFFISKMHILLYLSLASYATCLIVGNQTFDANYATYGPRPEQNIQLDAIIADPFGMCNLEINSFSPPSNYQVFN